MGIDPKVEEPTRDLLGHAIRGEWEQFANVAEDIGLLISYRKHGTDWWEYLDQIENARDGRPSVRGRRLGTAPAVTKETRAEQVSVSPLAQPDTELRRIAERPRVVEFGARAHYG
jgi:hypothetical protein